MKKILLVLILSIRICAKDVICIISPPNNGEEVLSRIVSKLTNFNEVFNIEYLKALDKDISKLSNSIITTHLIYTSNNIEIIKQNDLKCIYVYRDPRDYILNFAETMSYILDSREPLLIYIKNVIRSFSNYSEYKNIYSFYNSFNQWKSQSNIFITTYENIVNKDLNKQILEIQRLTKFLNLNISNEMILSAIKDPSVKNLKKSNSPIGRWKQTYSDKIKTLFLESAENLLIEMGYEDSNNW